MIYSPASGPAGHALRPIANGPTGQKKEAGETGGQKKEADEAGIGLLWVFPRPAAARPPPQTCLG